MTSLGVEIVTAFKPSSASLHDGLRCFHNVDRDGDSLELSQDSSSV